MRIAPARSAVAFLAFFVALSPAARSAQSAPAKGADYSKEAYVIEQLSWKVAFENDGTSVSETSARIHIQSDAGLKAWGVLAWPYASATTNLDLAYVRVTKADGRVIETPAENVIEMPADITRQAPFYSDLKEKQIAVKGLETGDTLEYRYRERVHTPIAPGQFWLTYGFFQAGIVLREDLEISVRRDRYVQMTSPGLAPDIREQEGRRIYHWTAAHLQHDSKTSNSEAEDEDAASKHSVQVTTFQNWEEVGKWFGSLAGPRAIPTAEIRSKAAELTRGATTDAEKTHEIYNYVSTKFRYIGVSLGIGRYQPHAAAEVLTNDYGDCKDKHTLLAALLAAAGIPAYPALINSRNKIDPAVPSPDQFDHVITAIPQGQGFLWLDTTTEVGPLGYLAPELRGKEALVVPVNAPAHLSTTPEELPFAAYLNFDIHGTLKNDGNFEGRVQLATRGDLEVTLRSALRSTGEAQWTDVIQTLSYNLGFGGAVSDVRADAPESTDTPFHLEYSYTRKEYGDWGNRRITAPLPPIYMPEVPDRADNPPKPLEWTIPSEVTLRADVKLPEDSRLVPLAGITLKESFAEYHSTYSLSGSDWQAKRDMTIKMRRVPVSQLEAYRKFRKVIADEEGAWMPLNGGDGGAVATSGSPEAQGFYERGRQAWQQRNMSEALDWFQRAVDHDARFAQAWVALGTLHLAMRDASRGAEELRKAVALDPAQAAAVKPMMGMLVAMQRQEDVLVIWREIEKQNPDDAEAPRMIGGILLQMKRYDEAATELEASLHKNPEDATLQVELGQADLLSGKQEKGFARLEKIVAKNPSGEILNETAYLLGDNRFRLPEALDYAEKAVRQIEKDTDDISLDSLQSNDLSNMSRLAAYWDTLGWVHFRMEHLPEAEKYLSAAWNLSQSGLIGDHLGQVYEKQGRKQPAARMYALAIATDHAPSETRGRLALLQPSSSKAEQEARGELTNLRMVQLPKLTEKNASAEFWILLAPGPKVLGVSFISGSDLFRKADAVVSAAKFDVRFPDRGPIKVLRRGLLDCETVLPHCEMVLFPPDSVRSIP